MNTEEVKKVLRGEKVSHDAVRSKNSLLSTGSTLLNLALTDTPHGGFLKGTYILFVGDSDSGKTFFSLTCLAEASINSAFDDYRFLLINKERGALMDIERYFGPKVEERLEWQDDVETVEQMYYYLDDALAGEKPFICVVDSIDALSSGYEGERFEMRKKADRAGKDAPGDYGDGKAKLHSGNIRRILSGLEKTGSICIFINQTRDSIGGLGSTKTHSGGRAISFYATMKLWSSPGGKILKNFRGKDRQQGIYSAIQVVRTRVTGKQNKVKIPIYHSFGIDDLGSCCDFLVEEKHWETKGRKILAAEFDLSATRETLVKQIEEKGYEKDLKDLVGEVWMEIDEALRIERKPRY